MIGGGGGGDLPRTTSISYSAKVCISTKLTDPLNLEKLKNYEIKVMNRSELKFFFLRHPVDGV